MLMHRRFILYMYEKFFTLPVHLKPFNAYLDEILSAINNNSKDIRYIKCDTYVVKIMYKNKTIKLSQWGDELSLLKVAVENSDYVYLEKFPYILRKKLKTIFKVVRKLCEEKEPYKEISSILSPFND